MLRVLRRLFAQKKCMPFRKPRPAAQSSFRPRLLDLENRITPSCEGFVTYTQGFYGAAPPGAAYLDSHFDGAFAELTVGAVGENVNELTLTDSAAVQAFLPSGTTPRALEQDYLNPSGGPEGTYRNVLAGQAVTTALNIGFDSTYADFAPSTENLADLTFQDHDELNNPVANSLNGLTVQEILDAANQYLADGSGPYSADQLNDALDKINNNFDEGIQDLGYLVCDVPPVITDVDCPVNAINEDDSVTLTVNFTDADDDGTGVYTVVVDWSAAGSAAPGTEAPTTVLIAANGTGSYSVSVSHQYLDDNTTATLADLYKIKVTVTDPDELSDEHTCDLLVNNVAPELGDSISQLPAPVAGSPADGVPGMELDFSDTFSDVGTQDTHSATWNWGDGSPVEAGSVTEAGGSGTVAGTHIYSTYGNFTITLTLTDDDGAVDVVTKTVVIGPVAILTPVFCGGGTPGPAIVIGGLVVADKLHVTHDDDSYKIFIDNGNDGVNEFTFDIPEGTPVIGRIVVFGNGGNDDINISSNSVDRHCIHGGDGDDTIKVTGASGSSLIEGGAGNDDIKGGSARDIIIGGTGADKISGGGGADLLIAGTTYWDDNDAALGKIMDEWLRTDLNAAARKANLEAGAGALAGVKLNNTTVFDDSSVDDLQGGSGGPDDNDWGFANLIGGIALDLVSHLEFTSEVLPD